MPLPPPITIREARAAKGLTIAELATLTGTHAPNVSLYERGLLRLPDNRVRDFAEALGVDTASLHRGQHELRETTVARLRGGGCTVGVA